MFVGLFAGEADPRLHHICFHEHALLHVYSCFDEYVLCHSFLHCFTFGKPIKTYTQLLELWDSKIGLAVGANSQIFVALLYSTSYL